MHPCTHMLHSRRPSVLDSSKKYQHVLQYTVRVSTSCLQLTKLASRLNSRPSQFSPGDGCASRSCVIASSHFRLCGHDVLERMPPQCLASSDPLHQTRGDKTWQKPDEGVNDYSEDVQGLRAPED